MEGLPQEILEQEPKLKAVYEFVEKAHEGQTRKNSNLPYIVHPRSVLIRYFDLIKKYNQKDLTFNFSQFDICAAILSHDVLEDCNVGLDKLVEFTSPQTLEIVGWLTNFKNLKGSRKYRKQLMFDRLKHAPLVVKLIKILDRIDNVVDMKVTDPEFYWKKYRAESIEIYKICSLNLGGLGVPRLILEDACRLLAIELNY